MTNLNPEICRKLRDARRAAKLSQSDLAAEVGCLQSAISMFEQGNPTKLNDEVVEKIAAKFKFDLKAEQEKYRSAPSVVLSPASQCSDEAAHRLFGGAVVEPMRGFCPNPNCPSNHAYAVDGRKLYLPHRETADPVGGKFCAVCGEVLEKKCPNCGAPVHAGAICSHCGQPYLAV